MFGGNHNRDFFSQHEPQDVYRRSRIRFRAQQTPEVKSRTAEGPESKTPQPTYELKTPTDAIKLLDRLASTVEPLPEALFILLGADKLDESYAKAVLNETALTPPETRAEKEALDTRVENLFCRITLELIRDPVKAADKYTYEASAFQQAIAGATPTKRKKWAEEGGISGPRLPNLNVTKDKSARTDIINILKHHAKKLAKQAKTTEPVREEHVLTPPKDILKDIMWPKTPDEFINCPNPFVRLALSQLRDPDLDITLVDVAPISGNLMLETKEGSLESQERLTKELKEIFPGAGNDADTFRIPSEAEDRLFGVKINWESEAIEGIGSHQEDWRQNAEELGAPITELTPIMSSTYASQTILRLLQNILNPENAFGAHSRSLESFPTIDQQKEVNADPDLINVIYQVLTSEGKPYNENPIDPSKIANLNKLKELLSKFKGAINLVISENAFDKEGKPFVRIRIMQPLFAQMLDELGKKYPALQPSITKAQEPRYRTAIRESFVNEATALATGGTRAKADLEFKGIANGEAFFTVKAQLPKIQSQAPKRFVFNFDASASMNLADLEQLELIKELFIEQNTTKTWGKDNKFILSPPEEKFLADKMKLSDETLNALQRFVEEKQRKEGDRFPKIYNDIVAALKTPARVPTRLYYAKKAFKAAHEQIKNIPNARLTLMKFGDKEGGKIVSGFEDVAVNDARVLAEIDKIEADAEGTHFIPAVKTMLTLRKNRDEELIVITLTDGETSEMGNGQTAPQIKKAITEEFARAGFQPTSIIVGYKFNEIKATRRQDEKPEDTEARSKALQNGAEQVIKDFAAISGPGSDAYPVQQSHRLERVFASKGKEYVKKAANIVSLPVERKDGIGALDLVAYPNEYFEKTVRIPFGGTPEITFPGFGPQVIDTRFIASPEIIASAHIAEMERQLVAEGIDPRVSASFASVQAQQTIAEFREGAVKKIQEAKNNLTIAAAQTEVISYLDKVKNSNFTPDLNKKIAGINSVAKDKIKLDSEIAESRKLKEATDKSDTEQKIREAAIAEYTNLQQRQKGNQPRYRMPSKGTPANLETKKTEAREITPLQPNISDYVEQKAREWKANRAGIMTEQKKQVSPQLVDIRKLHEDKSTKDAYSTLTQSFLQQVSVKTKTQAQPLPAVSFAYESKRPAEVKRQPRVEFKEPPARAPSIAPTRKPITDQGAVFVLDWDDTIIDGNSSNVLIDAHGWPSEHKTDTPERRKALEDKLWETVKNMPAIGGSWERWGNVFRTLINSGHVPAIASLNLYGQLIMPRFMREKMGLTPDEINQIHVLSYQIESSEQGLDPNEEFGKENHLFRLMEEQKIPLEKPKILIDDNKRNTDLFTKNAKATPGRELDRAILATHDGAHISTLMNLALDLAPKQATPAPVSRHTRTTYPTPSVPPRAEVKADREVKTHRQAEPALGHQIIPGLKIYDFLLNSVGDQGRKESRLNNLLKKSLLLFNVVLSELSDSNLEKFKTITFESLTREQFSQLINALKEDISTLSQAGIEDADKKRLDDLLANFTKQKPVSIPPVVTPRPIAVADTAASVRMRPPTPQPAAPTPAVRNLSPAFTNPLATQAGSASARIFTPANRAEIKESALTVEQGAELISLLKLRLNNPIINFLKFENGKLISKFRMNHSDITPLLDQIPLLAALPGIKFSNISYPKMGLGITPPGNYVEYQLEITDPIALKKALEPGVDLKR